MSEPTPDVLHLKIIPGRLEYLDARGQRKALRFQSNPTSLTRSRSISVIESKAANPAQGTTKRRGLAGRKFTHNAGPWTISSIELSFDASRSFELPEDDAGAPAQPGGSTAGRDAGGSAPSAASDTLPLQRNLASIMEAIKHIEAMAEPGPESTENESQTNSQPAASPPLVTLVLGERRWQGYVTSVTILEKEFTPTLKPKQVKVTLGLQLIVSNPELDQGKTGGRK